MFYWLGFDPFATKFESFTNHVPPPPPPPSPLLTTPTAPRRRLWWPRRATSFWAGREDAGAMLWCDTFKRARRRRFNKRCFTKHRIVTSLHPSNAIASGSKQPAWSLSATIPLRRVVSAARPMRRRCVAERREVTTRVWVESAEVFSTRPESCWLCQWWAEEL